MMGLRNNAILLRIDGTLVAPSKYGVIGNAKNCLIFEQVNGVTISGGTLDGQGAGLWSCKNSGKDCPNGATDGTFASHGNKSFSTLVLLIKRFNHPYIWILKTVNEKDCHNMLIEEEDGLSKIVCGCSSSWRDENFDYPSQHVGVLGGALYLCCLIDTYKWDHLESDMQRMEMDASEAVHYSTGDHKTIPNLTGRMLSVGG
ncbi:unnamed protein product [Dovyalis caffra]|uniref:Uncharacterized protein n=1 Tax=Dovyalis caffra TaxID=77055 RepID=A0AAV1QTA5_9ROSI|nr:unnamed protein product [Dovyalis caffra]